jgi:hypothetical protein
MPQNIILNINRVLKDKVSIKTEKKNNLATYVLLRKNNNNLQKIYYLILITKILKIYEKDNNLRKR